jgi:hypothetical protein
MPKVYCFGSEHYDGDEVALKLAPSLSISGYDFIVAETPTEIMKAQGSIYIMDVVKGIDAVQILDNVDDLSLCNSLTCHDLDVGFFLKLMKETGKLSSVQIIALPFGEKDYAKLKDGVESLLLN